MERVLDIKKEGDKYYQVDSDGNHVKDKAGNEKAYTLNADGSLVRDNSNTKPAAPAKSNRSSKPSATSKPVAGGNKGNSKPAVVREWIDNYGNKQIEYSNGNRTIYNNGSNIYATGEDIYDRNGNHTSSVWRNRDGQVTLKCKYTSNKDGTYYNDSKYYNGAYHNRIIREPIDNNGEKITDEDKAAKTAGLRASKKYSGYYTDGKNFYRWDKENTQFVMCAKTKLAKIFNSWNPKYE